jgi:hypothetical protein
MQVAGVQDRLFVSESAHIRLGQLHTVRRFNSMLVNCISFGMFHPRSLSKAKQVVLVAHGPGCDALMETISERGK